MASFRNFIFSHIPRCKFSQLISILPGMPGLFTSRELYTGALHLPNPPPAIERIVIMGVAGCGKSTLGQAIAQQMGWAIIEGDDFHSQENKAKMRGGVALVDADRQGWLRSLADELRVRKGSLVLTCSALKRSYRDILREASPGLGFIYLDITEAGALERLRQRSQHFFPPQLLSSQFETLEIPVDEPGVIHLNPQLPLPQLVETTVTWLTDSSRQS